MTCATRKRLWLVLAFLLPCSAAQAGGVQLRPGSADRLPRIAEPANPAARRINTALASADRAFAAFASRCRARDRHCFVSRNVAVTARGPAMLAIVTTDHANCGGAYPNTGTLALVFDLKSGRLAD